MMKVLNLVLLLLAAQLTQAATLVPLADNGHAPLAISSSQYNRLAVQGETITALRYPKSHLAADYDADGSVYLDLLDEGPTTVFITTHHHHYSLTLTGRPQVGQTVMLTAADPSALPSPQALLEAVGKHKRLRGFHEVAVDARPIRLRPTLRLTPRYTLQNPHYSAQQFTLFNLSEKPMTLQADWFSDAHTQVVRLGCHTLKPHQKTTVTRLEVADG